MSEQEQLVPESYKSVKSYIVNLDEEPEMRWKEIAHEYAADIKRLLRYCDTILGQLSYPATWLAYLFSNSVFYIEELKGISKVTGIELSQLILMQFCYEICACCTSIIIDKEDETFHYRTMDWEMPELKDLTIQVIFIKNGVELYTAACWAGYVGVLTGVKKNIASISLNYRRTKNGSIISNLNAMISGSWPPGFLIRHSLEISDSYDEILKYLSNSELISPCYIIINGDSPGTGKILVRDKSKIDQIIKIDKDYKINHVVQTNIDHNRMNDKATPNILMSRERMIRIDDIMKDNKVIYIPDIYHILKLFNTYPIVNSETIYVSIMNCDTGRMYTWVINDN